MLKNWTPHQKSQLLSVAGHTPFVFTVERFEARHAEASLDQLVCGVWRFESDLCSEVWSHFADQEACDAFWQASGTTTPKCRIRNFYCLFCRDSRAGMDRMPMGRIDIRQPSSRFTDIVSRAPRPNEMPWSIVQSAARRNSSVPPRAVSSDV